MGTFKDLTGKHFGKLKVIEKAAPKNKRVHWKCICDCGNICIVSRNNLAQSHTKSCGCILQPSDSEYIEKTKKRMRMFYDHNIVTNCWEWKGYCYSFGYGLASFRNKKILAHRLMWKLYKGEIPKELYVLHSCDNRRCCNPNHLFLGTPKDNMDDMKEKGRRISVPSRGQEHGCSKLKEDDILRIRKLKKSGLTNKEISKIFPVSESSVKKITSRCTWKHLQDPE